MIGLLARRYLGILAALFAWALTLAPVAPACAAGEQRYGIFERIGESSAPFEETATALEAALRQSQMVVQGQMDVALGAQAQRARVFVLTSPQFEAAAASEAPRTISAQVLRLAVSEYGKGRKTYVDMANSLAHAIVYYAGSKNYAGLLEAAQQMRNAMASMAGVNAVSVPIEPSRSESALNNFDGDTAAKIMARWRNWRQPQRVVLSDKPENFAHAIERVEHAIRASNDKGAGDPSGRRLVSEIPIGPNAAYFGISNAYTENKCLRINSGSRDEGKSDDAPLPGVDRAPALPLEVLVKNEGKHVQAAQYGQMWRMQLYFWNSGYGAFAKNAGVPGTLADSIEAMLKAAPAQASAPGGH